MHAWRSKYMARDRSTDCLCSYNLPVHYIIMILLSRLLFYAPLTKYFKVLEKVNTVSISGGVRCGKMHARAS
jgi:hypothetical protein